MPGKGAFEIETPKPEGTWGFGESLKELHFAVDAYLERARAACSKNQGRLYVLRQKWFRYAYFLMAILNRFREAEQLLGEIFRTSTIGTLDAANLTEIRTIRSNNLLLEVESFYLFSKILLNRIADTIAFVFNWELKRRGSSHAALCKGLQQLAADRYLLLPPGFTEMAAALNEKIVHTRNSLFDHATDFGPIGILIDAPGASGILRMEDAYAPDEPAAGAQATGHLYQLADDISDYMRVVVILLRSNVDRGRVV